MRGTKLWGIGLRITNIWEFMGLRVHSEGESDCIGKKRTRWTVTLLTSLQLRLWCSVSQFVCPFRISLLCIFILLLYGLAPSTIGSLSWITYVSFTCPSLSLQPSFFYDLICLWIYEGPGFTTNLMDWSKIFVQVSLNQRKRRMKCVRSWRNRHLIKIN